MTFLRSSRMVMPASAVDVLGLQARNDAVEVHGLELVLKLQFLAMAAHRSTSKPV